MSNTMWEWFLKGTVGGTRDEDIANRGLRFVALAMAGLGGFALVGAIVFPGSTIQRLVVAALGIVLISLDAFVILPKLNRSS